jgi:hypothetical protein
VLAVFLFGLPIVQGIIAPQYRHFARYIFPVIPFVALAIAESIQNLLVRRNIDKLTIQYRIWRAVLVTTFVIAILPLTIKWIRQYGTSVSNINDQHLAIASWVSNHAAPSDIIAADDVGALGYFTKRNILDLTGLVTPAMYELQYDQKLIWKSARDQGADLFIIYTRLNPGLYEFARDSLELLQVFPVRQPLVSSADSVMSIFRVKGTTIATR